MSDEGNSLMPEKKRSPFLELDFGSIFQIPARYDDEEDTRQASEAEDLKAYFPDNAKEIAAFVWKAIHLRQDIVKKLSVAPEVNNHAIFMLIMRMYGDTLNGVGYSHARMQAWIRRLSPGSPSASKVSKMIKVATDKEIFKKLHPEQDRRESRYYLHEDMITLVSDSFGQILQAAREIDEDAFSNPRAS